MLLLQKKKPVGSGLYGKYSWLCGYVAFLMGKVFCPPLALPGHHWKVSQLTWASISSPGNVNSSICLALLLRRLSESVPVAYIACGL
jgi:hypothetical protein